MKKKVLFVILAAFFIGFSSSIAQAIMIRELLTIFRGNELSVGIIMAIWLGGIFTGAVFSKTKQIVHPKFIIAMIIVHPFLFLVSLIVLYSIPIVYSSYGAFYQLDAEIMIALLCLFPQCFVIGYVFPVLIQYADELLIKHPGSIVFLLESSGAFAGGIVFTFFILFVLNPIGTAIVLLLCATILSLLIYNQKKHYVTITLVCIILLFLTTQTNKAEQALIQKSFAINHPGSLLLYKRTPYQMMYVAKNYDTYSLYGNNIFYTQLPDDYEVRPLLHALFASIHDILGKNILIAGDTLYLPYVATKLQASIDYCTVDRSLWNTFHTLGKQLYPNFDFNKLNVIFSDTRGLLSKTPRRWDGIVIIPPPPDSILHNRLYTLEFFQFCKMHLNQDGVFIMQIEGFANIMNPSLQRYISSVLNSFTKMFPTSIVSAGETIYLIGFNTGNTIDFNNYRQNYLANFLKSDTGKSVAALIPHFNPKELDMFFQSTHLAYLNTAIKHSAMLNTDIMPQAYFEYLANTLKQTDSYTGNFIMQPAVMAIIMICIVVAATVYFLRRGKEHAVKGLVVFIAGFISMSAMVIALMAYQNVYGILYYRIAFCNALFMLGLASGCTTTFAAKPLYAMRIVILIGSLAMLALFIIMKHVWLLYCAIFFIAAITGSLLPLLLKNTQETYTKRLLASTLDASDHLGAMCGALAAPFIVLPIFGMYSIGILLLLSISLFIFKKWI